MKNVEKELVELYRYVYCFVKSKINDADYARDITQEVMEIALEKYSTLRKKEALRAWVLQIARNKIKAYYKDLKRINATFIYQGCDSEELVENYIDNVADIKADILALIIEKEDKKNLIRAFNCLERKYREVIRLNCICGYNFIEISEILSVNVNTVRTWSARGLKKMKEELIKIEAGEEHESIR